MHLVAARLPVLALPAHTAAAAAELHTVVDQLHLAAAAAFVGPLEVELELACQAGLPWAAAHTEGFAAASVLLLGLMQQKVSLLPALETGCQRAKAGCQTGQG